MSFRVSEGLQKNLNLVYYFAIKSILEFLFDVESEKRALQFSGFVDVMSIVL
jgi:hypothetical protein